LRAGAKSPGQGIAVTTAPQRSAIATVSSLEPV